MVLVPDRVERFVELSSAGLQAGGGAPLLLARPAADLPRQAEAKPHTQTKQTIQTEQVRDL